MSEKTGNNIAIIGMAGKFPGADSIDQYWDNILGGVDCIREYDLEDVIASGVERSKALSTGYVRRGANLDDIDKFDASFFGFLPSEAALLDPQIRIFLETVQQALDNAGCDPDRYSGEIGVFAGAGLNNYFLKNIMRNPGRFEDIVDFQTIISNDKDFLSTQVNYKFNLTGPGMTVQTGCSTSMVAIQQAYLSLLGNQCDVALAGGVHIRSPRALGYEYKEGEILSSDGYCRPFDSKAGGTVFGEGVGIVVLKRLEDAIADGDHIHGIVRGMALNNDGNNKVSYAAPSVNGQAAVIEKAQKIAGVRADEIGYVEAHGTGTKLGDPIEIRALTKAFEKSSGKKAFCALGSTKAMIGHLDVAAGVAGFIRATLAVKNGVLPNTLNFEEANPGLNLDESPFFINRKNQSWERGGKPRFAAVSSFGVGGTNAHAIIQEAPVNSSGETEHSYHVLPFSAKTPGALSAQIAAVKEVLSNDRGMKTADVAFTLQTGRREFGFRHAIICRDLGEAVGMLEGIVEKAEWYRTVDIPIDNVSFMFSGQGSQYPGMCRDLYDHFPVFRACIDSCAESVEDILGFNFLKALFPDDESDLDKYDINQTYLAQPILYSIECALFLLWSDWGIRPKRMIGHSLGELVAAFAAGVFSLTDGARIVAARGRLMQSMPEGAMLSLRNSREDVEAALADYDVSVVVVNGPELTVVGGERAVIEGLKADLEKEDIRSNLLRTSHAFHSAMMNNAVIPFIEEISKYRLSKPTIPFISNVTGSWITEEDAIDPSYWGNQIRQPVNFSRGIDSLCSEEDTILLEVGPGSTLCTLCQFQDSPVGDIPSVNSVQQLQHDINDVEFIYNALGQLWQKGYKDAFSGIYAGEIRKKVPLPGYSFERRSYWLEKVSDSLEESAVQVRKVRFGEQFAGIADKGKPDVRSIIEDVWCKVLGFSEIKGEDNFFDLGGHSLVAAQVLSMLQNKLSVQVPLSLLNSSSTFLDFTRSVEELCDINPLSADDAETVEKQIQSSWPLSPQQKRLWFFREYAGILLHYNLAQTVLIQGGIDLSLIKRAVDFVMSIHESFQVEFSSENGEIIVHRSESPRVSEIFHLTGVSSDEQDSEILEEIKRENRRVKDLENEALRVVIYAFSDERAAVVLYIPHILSDGMSFNVFCEHLAKACRNLAGGREISEGLHMEFQYSDYVSWLELKSPSETKSQEVFWKEYLADIPDLIQLPSERPRPLELSGLGSALHFYLNERESENIKDFCREKRVTPFVFFLSCFYLLLWKYSSQKQIMVGVSSANRSQDEFRSIIGFFVDMIPVKADLNSRYCFAEWIEFIGNSFSQAYDNKDIGFEKIVELSGIKRAANVHPLFQVTFNYLKMAEEGMVGDDFSLHELVVDRGVSEYDLTLYMWEEESFCGVFEFAEDILDADQVERMQSHFREIVSWALDNRSGMIRDLTLLDSHDLASLKEVNDTRRDEFLGKVFPSLFERALSAYSHRTAVKGSGRELNYGELEVISAQLAARIHRESCEVVGVYVSRGINTVISLVSALKSGAAYIPMDPSFPVDRLAYMIEDSGMKTILVDGSTEGNNLLKDLDITVINIEDLPDEGLVLPPVEIRPSDTAYMIYTSGSTGKPKGVPIRHESLANFLLFVSEEPGIEPEDRILNLTTPSFDISLLEMLLPLINGATVIAVDAMATRDGEQLIEIIRDEQVNYIQATPVTWRMLLDAGWEGDGRIKMLCGGEALSKKLVEELIPMGKELWNCYGPTECTIWSSFSRIDDAQGDPDIGMPMANTSYYILDENNNVLPPGLVGELSIGGALVSPGYHNRSELTEKVFHDIHVPGEEGVKRVYRTGDLAIQRGGDKFYCLGRKDFQVKVRGYRIELEEIESHLQKIPEVRECCCLVIGADESTKALAAYYTSSSLLDVTYLRNKLTKNLPSYMVPQYFTRLDEFPKTPNKKIDRKALPEPDVGSVEVKKVDDGNLSELERQILNIWRNVLNIDSLGINDNFFDMGGHSLLAQSVIQKMNTEIGNSWKIKDLFLYPTVQSIAQKEETTSLTKMPLLFPVRKSGNSEPIFIVAGIYANDYHEKENSYERDFLRYFNNLIINLQADRPIYGLRPRGIYQGEEFHSDVRAMAREYIDEIKKIQPVGPYIIGGECLGGLVAYEIARQLKENGDDIHLLFMLDTYFGCFRNEIVYKLKEIKKAVKKMMESMNESSEQSRHLFPYLKTAAQIRKLYFPITRKEHKVRKDLLDSSYYAHKLIAYRPRRNPVNTLLLINEEWNDLDPHLTWNTKKMEYLREFIIPGNHSTKLTHYGSFLGHFLQEMLQNPDKRDQKS